MRTSSARSLLVMGALLVGAVVSEAAVRFVGYQPSLLEPTMFVAIDDVYCRYGLAPGYQGRYCGKKVSVDDRGFRLVRGGPGRPGAAKAERPTVLLVGDSVLFGQGVEDEETFASRLQQRADATGVGLRFENIGVPGYSTWNEYGALRRYLLAETPLHVVFLWVSNDMTSDLDSLGVAAGEFRHLKDDAVHRLLGWTYRHWFSSFLVADGIKRLLSPRRKEADFGGYTPEGLAHSVDGLTAARGLAEARGAGFSVGVFFDGPMARDLTTSSSWVRRALDAMERAGLNSFPVDSHTRALAVEEQQAFFNDPHPSSRATVIAVADVERELERRGVAVRAVRQGNPGER